MRNELEGVVEIQQGDDSVNINLMAAVAAGLFLAFAAVPSASAFERSTNALASGGEPGAARESASRRKPVAARGAQSGIASMYSHRGRTASGEPHRHNALTAAHRTLPFGTKVRVTNRRNGRSVVVRIIDRGPFIRGRVIDLSPAGARALGFSGLAPVTLAVLGRDG